MFRGRNYLYFVILLISVFGSGCFLNSSIGSLGSGANSENVPLLVSGPPQNALKMNSSYTVQVSGGLPPYVFTIVSGQGTVDSATGAFTASAQVGTVKIKVVDSLAQESIVEIQVYAELSVAQESLSVFSGVGDTLYPIAPPTGGLAPYSYSVISGPGSIDSSTGAFRVPFQTADTIVQIKDSDNNSKNITIRSAAMIVNGPVSRTAFNGDDAYISGNFNAVNPKGVPGFMALDKTSGNLITSHCYWQTRITGTVSAMTASTDNQFLFIGGSIQSYGGKTVQNLIKIKTSDCSLDTSFTLSSGIAGASLQINAIANMGSYIYVGGLFTSYRGTTVQNLIKVDATTGQLDSVFTQTQGPNSTVTSIAGDGTNVYIGGGFTSYRGVAASYLLKLDSSSGVLDTVFSQSSTFNGAILALSVSGSYIYAGGAFTTYRTLPARYLAKLALADGTLDQTFTQATGIDTASGAMTIIATSTSVFVGVGGGFTQYRGVYCHSFMKLDATNGNLDTTFSPALGASANSSTQSLSLDGSYLYVSSGTKVYRGSPAPYFFRVDTTSGNIDTSFGASLNLNSYPSSMLTTGDKVFAAGSFNAAYGTSLPYLVKFKLSTGEIDTTFTQSTGLNGAAGALLIQGTSLYVAGSFTSYRGTNVPNLIKLDLDNGNLDTSFSQGLTVGGDDSILDMATSGSSLYIVGSFSLYRGTTALKVAKVDLATGNIDTAFSQGMGITPSHGIVYSALIANNSLYVGGQNLTSYRGTTVQNLLKLDLANGNLDATFSQTTGFASAQLRGLQAAGGAIYVSGLLVTYRGTSVVSRGAVKLDENSGNLDTNFLPLTISVPLGNMYVDGNSLFIEGVGSTALGKYSASTGAVDSSFNSSIVITDPSFQSYLKPCGTNICMAGAFTSYQSYEPHFFMMFDPSTGIAK